MLPFDHLPPTFHRLLPTDQWPNWTPHSDHGTISPRPLPLWARQLGWAHATGAIRIHQLDACFNEDDSILGCLSSESPNAVEGSQHPSWPEVRDRSGCCASMTGRDSLNPTRQLARGSTATLVLATVPDLDLVGNIGLSGNGLTTSKIDDFLNELSN